jgi:hypothetical protein
LYNLKKASYKTKSRFQLCTKNFGTNNVTPSTYKDSFCGCYNGEKKACLPDGLRQPTSEVIEVELRLLLEDGGQRAVETVL